MRPDFDIAVLGSGFAGSLMAMIARRLGRSVILVERGRHPRFAIGESSTPLANLLLESLALRYGLPSIVPFCKWGTWRKAHPGIACGLKRGFSFFHHAWGKEWQDDEERSRQLLVAASPHDEVADTHWYRSEFDSFLVREAQKHGVEFSDRTQLQAADFSGSNATLECEREGKLFSIQARLVVDATGPRGALARLLNLPEVSFPSMPATHGLFSHFENVARWESFHSSAETPPFPVDDAALHHVFDGGWIWVLRFDNGLTSAGVAITASKARALQWTGEAKDWEHLLKQLPAVREQFACARTTMPFTHTPRLSYLASRAVGSKWVLLPSAAGFVDPLLSTGFPLTLLGIERLARIIENDWQSPRMEKALASYETRTLNELEVAASLVGALYANMEDPSTFSALTLLYFAAAMYTETMHRLGHREATDSFLLSQHARFAPNLRAILDSSRSRVRNDGGTCLKDSILRAIEPFNLARLGDASLRNWHPCRTQDLLAAAPKLEVERADLERLLERCGFSSQRNASAVKPACHAP